MNIMTECRSCHKNGIIDRTNDHFLTHKELQMKYNIKTNQILMLQIYSSIPKDWIKIF